MRSRLIAPSCLWLIPALLSAQSLAVRKCDPPEVPLGRLRGLGQVSYLVDGKGRPDTASVRVIAADGLSLGGLRSAATRVLSACSLQAPAKAPGGGQSVSQTLRFNELQVQMSPAEVTSRLEADFVLVPPRIPQEPLEVTDSMLEERPHEIGCDRKPVYPIIAGTSRSFNEAMDARVAWERDNSGTVKARVIVGIDGRVEQGSLVIVSSTNSTLVNVYRPVMASCRYAPGRIAGVPVRTVVTMERGAKFVSGPS